jgi:hypothetical protein
MVVAFHPFYSAAGNSYDLSLPFRGQTRITAAPAPEIPERRHAGRADDAQAGDHDVGIEGGHAAGFTKRRATATPPHKTPSADAAKSTTAGFRPGEKCCRYSSIPA